MGGGGNRQQGDTARLVLNKESKGKVIPVQAAEALRVARG
jgi:hypothetical protein